MSNVRVRKPVSEWADPRQVRGYAGERAAMAYLLQRGWRIEAHRFRLGHHDLDLVARQGSVVAFVEVKTRRSLRFGDASLAVGFRKQAVLARLAELWRVRFGRPQDRYRFDLITVLEGRGRSPSPQVTHIEDAWRCVEN
ncbi:MAG: YraN family protein [Gemmatimonadales bacterium]